MKEILYTHKKTIIIAVVLLIIISVLIIFIVPIFHKEKLEDLVNDELEITLSSKEQEEQNLYEIGYALYEEATNIYLMNPYCGIAYEDIDDDSIIIINGEEYYRSNMATTNDINNKIAETMENSNIMINNTIEKNGLVYCKYNKPPKSNSYLGTTNLTISSIQEKQVSFIATSYYIASNHSELCNINSIFDCTNSDKVKEDNNFVIVNINGSWKVREFYVHH